MNDWNNDRFKKDAETEDLSFFLDTYNLRTDNKLELVEQSERPDFICQFEDGTMVGVELTSITRNPKTRNWDTIVEKSEFMESESALEMIQTLIEEKDIKRSTPDWKLSEHAILLIQLKDISITELEPFLKPEFFSDVNETGFKEIWLGDYTEVEPYNAISLFCLKPNERFGFYSKPNPYQKPFG